MSKRGRIWFELPKLKRGRMETNIVEKKKPKQDKVLRKRKILNNEVEDSILSEMFEQVSVRQKQKIVENQNKEEKKEVTEESEKTVEEEQQTTNQHTPEEQKLFLQSLNTLLKAAPFAEQFLAVQLDARFQEMANLEKIGNSQENLQTLISDHVLELKQSTSQFTKMMLVFSRLVNMMNVSLDVSLEMQSRNSDNL
jgi:hypothetical protein